MNKSLFPVIEKLTRRNIHWEQQINVILKSKNFYKSSDNEILEDIKKEIEDNNHKIRQLKLQEEKNEEKKDVVIETDEKKFLNVVRLATENFFLHGSRSSKKVDTIHFYIKEELEQKIQQFKQLNKDNNDYLEVKVECKIPSINESNNKRCDVVVFKNNIPFIVFPVKFIMSNYKQNKNNFWENLTGEIMHLKYANQELNIIPLNIIFSSVPYLNNKKMIVKFENITIENSFGITNKLIEWSLCSDVINLIIDVEHVCNINEVYDKAPKLLQFNKNNNFLPFSYYLNKYL
jgi:hypothetical protein